MSATTQKMASVAGGFKLSSWAGAMATKKQETTAGVIGGKYPIVVAGVQVSPAWTAVVENKLSGVTQSHPTSPMMSSTSHDDSPPKIVNDYACPIDGAKYL
uniref:Uncharacterized protein n=1 Tax=Cannabis sativa TaxID=3483 RepID=A0A803PMF3_CANSA